MSTTEVREAGEAFLRVSQTLGDHFEMQVPAPGAREMSPPEPQEHLGAPEGDHEPRADS